MRDFFSRAKNPKLKSSISVTLGTLILLAGCAPAPVSGESASSNSPSPSVTDELGPDLLEAFRMIAKASCDKAFEEGVTERVEGSADRIVLVPEAFLYNDFSAAVVNDDGGVQPIWSTDVFSACNDHINFSMAEDADAEYEVLVSRDPVSGNLKSQYQVADYGAIVSEYAVEGGVLVKVWTTFPDGEAVTALDYGIPSESDLASFREAIDLFLAED